YLGAWPSPCRQAPLTCWWLPPGAAAATPSCAHEPADQEQQCGDDGDDEQPVHGETDAEQDDRQQCKQDQKKHWLTSSLSSWTLGLVLRPRRADALVAISHEGTTALTLEATRAFDGPVWLITGKAESPQAELANEVIVCTPEVERSWCHTASYTCAVAALAALH